MIAITTLVFFVNPAILTVWWIILSCLKTFSLSFQCIVHHFLIKIFYRFLSFCSNRYLCQNYNLRFQITFKKSHDSRHFYRSHIFCNCFFVYNLSNLSGPTILGRLIKYKIAERVWSLLWNELLPHIPPPFQADSHYPPYILVFLL